MTATSARSAVRRSRGRVSAIEPVAELTSDQQVAAILHPVRRRVLAALAHPASAAEVARELGITAQIANYHVRALEAAGLAREVETRRKRNLLERRFRALARSFTLSSALPLTEEQRHRLQSDAALQQLVQAGDAIRADALRLLERASTGTAEIDEGHEATRATDAREAGKANEGNTASTHSSTHPAAAIELDVELGAETDRTAFVRAVLDAVRSAAAPFSAPRRGGTSPLDAAPAPFHVHLAIYPSPTEGAPGNARHLGDSA